MSRWLHSATEGLFVATEAMVWFIVIRVLASTLDHASLVEMRERVELGLGGPVDDPRVIVAVGALRDAVGGVTSGPALPIVIVTAFAAFFLMRTMQQLRISGAAAAVAGLLASVVLLNALLHVAFTGDLMIWDSSGLTNLLSDPQTPLVGERDPVAFVANPDPDAVRGSSLALVVFGMFLMWGRFLFVGRGTIPFERALRSFTIGFPIVLVSALLSSISGVSAGMFALPYFVMAMLTLAVANAARTTGADTELSRSGPWGALGAGDDGVAGVGGGAVRPAGVPRGRSGADADRHNRAADRELGDGDPAHAGVLAAGSGAQQAALRLRPGVPPERRPRTSALRNRRSSSRRPASGRAG